MPGDVAVERPQARVVGYKPEQGPRVRLDGQRVPAEGVRHRRPGRQDLVVVVGPVKRAFAGL